MSNNETYKKLISFLDGNNAEYKLIDHEPEGRTDIISPIRGHETKDAAKCMILMVKITKKLKKYVLAVVPGDARVNMGKIKELYKASYVSFATPEIAEELAGSVSGTVLPFVFNEGLEQIIDPKVFESETTYFNAARLDQSVALKTEDYKRLVLDAKLEEIAQY